MNDSNLKKIEEITKNLLNEIGEDTEREGLLKTPSRVAKAWHAFVKGYSQTPKEVVGDAVFEESCDEIVTVKDIDFFLFVNIISYLLKG